MSIQDQRDRQLRERRERETRLNQESPIFFLRNNHVAKTSVAEKYETGWKAEAAARATILDGFLSERRKIQTSDAYTATGRREAMEKELRKVVAYLKTEDARVNTRIGSEVERRTAAVVANAADTKEDPTARYWRLREIRDHVAGLDPLLVPLALQQAAERGTRVAFDWLAALEAAPIPMYPQLVAETRAKLVETTDPELGALAELQRAHTWDLNFIRSGLRDAATADGVDFAALTPEENA